MSKDKKIRVRFAPSPTGPLHIGGARTALFNWLFAKANGGEFVLRIEDTDSERSKEEYEVDIKEGLTWLGLEWDDFFRQSDRKKIYREYLEKLLEENKAYYCFCSKEELEAEKEAHLSQGLASKYSGRCRSIKPEEARERVDGGEGYVIRVKIPDREVSFDDLIRGKITFDGTLIGDTVVARDLDNPLYNFVVVIDDSLNEVTHVIRGEDHISNTPLQIFLMESMGFDLPEFAHLPMILNPDKSKMSKRFSDVALSDYMRQGYLPDAMFNFLAFLGWHPKEDREVMTREEVINEFTLDRVQKGGAVFDIDKLNWLGKHYMKEASPKEIIEIVRGTVSSDWELKEAMMNPLKGRISKGSEAEDELRFYFDIPTYGADLLKWKEMNFGEVEINLNKTKEVLEKVPDKDFKRDVLEGKIMDLIPENEKGEWLWPLRVSLSGNDRSPGPFEIMEALGKEQSLSRIDIALRKISVPNETY